MPPLDRLGVDGQKLYGPTRGLDLGSLFLEHLLRAFPVREQVSAIAQEFCTRRLQGTPDAHPLAGVGPRRFVMRSSHAAGVAL